MLGNAYRMNNDLPAKIVQIWTPEGNRKRGRPKTTWQRTMEELKAAGLTCGTAARKAQERGLARSCASLMCHTA